MTAASTRRPGHVGQSPAVDGTVRPRRRGMLVQPGHVAPREVAERPGGPAREGQQALGPPGSAFEVRGAAVGVRRFPGGLRQRHRDRARRTGGPAGAVRGTGRPVALDHHMGVRSRPTEPADTRQGRSVTGTRPRRRLRRDPQRQPLPVDLRGGRLEVEVPRDHSPVHRQGDLDEAGDPRSRLQMTHVRLDRADQQRPLGGTTRPEDVRHRPQLDGVADRRSRAVGLQVVDLCRRDGRPAQRLGDDELLRLPVRHGESGAGPVLVQRRTPDHAPDPVAVGLGILQPLEDQDPAALAPDVAVGGRVERGATAVGRQHPGDGAHLEEAPREDGVHPSGQRQVGLAPPQTHHRLVHRHKRGRTGRVQGDRRPLQAERVGDPPDGRVERRAGDRVEAGRRVGDVGGLGDEPPVLVVADAGVDAGARARQPVRIDPRVLQGAPARLQHQPLLRVQQVRLHRRDPEERCVELVDAVEEGAEPAGRALDGVAEEFPDPARTGTRNTLRDGVAPFLQQAPERLETIRAGEPAGHADDRDRLLGGAPLAAPGRGLGGRGLLTRAAADRIIHFDVPARASARNTCTQPRC